jgi:hypothetical protein
MCVGSLDHLDNCKSFGVFNIFKSMFENGYIFYILMEEARYHSSISMPIPRHYSYGPRKLNIILTQQCTPDHSNAQII